MRTLYLLLLITLHTDFGQNETWLWGCNGRLVDGQKRLAETENSWPPGSC